MEKRWLCLSCIYFEQSTTLTFDQFYAFGPSHIIGEHVWRWCDKSMKAIRKLRESCKEYISVHQTQFVNKGENMVDIADIPSEGERVDLEKLPKVAELLAIDEKIQEQQSGKTGGVVITYQMRDDRTFPQKYSKISGKAFIDALIRLGYQNTNPLKEKWHEYELTPMRIGYPRMIPQKVIK